MTAPVVWAATNVLPKTVTVYKTEPQAFSESTISNILDLASFSSLGVEVSSDRKTMHWEAHDERGTLIRSLDITPSLGWVSYFDSDAQERSTNAAHGVPDTGHVKMLAARYLQRLGGDTNQLSFHPASATEQHRTLYDKKPWKGGHVILDDYTMRGIMLTRQLDGIRFNGAAVRGGIAIDFGTDARVAKLELVWRKLTPSKTCSVATQEQIMKMLKDGKGVLPSEQSADLTPLPTATRIAIRNVTFYYWGEPGGQAQDHVYPFASLEAQAQLAGTNMLPFTVECPVILEN